MFRTFTFLLERFKAASRYDTTLCDTFQYSKVHQRLTNGSLQPTRESTYGAIQDGHFRADNLVSVYHFEYRLKGIAYKSYGGSTADKYVGGCIFLDSMSSLLHVEHQLGVSGTDTI